MKPPGVAMEVAGVRAIESIESVGRVLGGVAVHDVEQHDQALRMRSVYKGFQFFRRAVATEMENNIYMGV